LLAHSPKAAIHGRTFHQQQASLKIVVGSLNDDRRGLDVL
jgi:hypothetical protein